jgi:hypothetical protein
VCILPCHRASGIIATGAKTNNTRRQVKAEAITADVLAQYTRSNSRNEKAIDKSVVALEKWDLSVKEALSILRISVRDNADVKRVVAALDKMSPDLLWNAMAALKAPPRFWVEVGLTGTTSFDLGPS